MEERCVGEDTVEMAIRQLELEEILLPYFATGMGARHRGETRGAVQTDREVTVIGQGLKVAAGPAAEIE